MGVGPVALELYHDLARRGLMAPGQDVCDIGSSDLVPENFQFSKLFAAFGRESSRVQTVRELMDSLGMPYDCIDLDGCHGARKFDLNYARAELQYEIVTNHGTTEHIFNQANCFEFIHDSTRQKGLMIHIVPHWGLHGTQGYSNHGLFLYTRCFFEDLARANGYHIVKLYTSDDRGGSMIVCVLQKVFSVKFIIPMQGVYDHLEREYGVKDQGRRQGCTREYAASKAIQGSL